MLCWVFISPIDFFVCFYNRFVLYLKILLKGWCIGRETGSTTNLFTITYTKCSWLHYGGESILFIGSHRNPYSKGRIVWCKILLHVFSTIVSNISNLIRSTIILLTLYAPHWFFFLLISLIGIYKIIKSMPFFQVVDVLHPGRSTVPRNEIRAKLAKVKWFWAFIGIS